MAGRQQADERVTREHLDIEQRMVERDVGETDVELVVDEPVRDELRAARVHEKLHVAALAQELRGDVLEEAVGERGHDADRQPPLPHGADGLGRTGDLLDAGEDAVDLAVEHHAVIGRDEPAAHPVEYGEADGVLEMGDQLAHGRLRDAQHVRRAADAAALDDRLEGFDLA